MGANVIVCPTDAEENDPENYHRKAHELGKKENHIHLDQYNNKYNPEAHYKTTGPELEE